MDIEYLESELKAYRKIADEVKLSELSTKMRQDAKLRQQGIVTEVYRAQRQVARIILAHECNLTQPSIYSPEQLEEFMRFQESQGTRWAFLADSAERAYNSRVGGERGSGLTGAATDSLIDAVGNHLVPM